MNFAIEAPAEANPLTIENLHHVLQSASSNDQHQVQTGAQQLQNWEKSPGFYSSLQTLHIDYSLPVELRCLAIIQLKNGIDKYWRKTALNAISADEKATIRSRSLKSVVEEPDHRLALQISVLIGKIVRHEYPQDWPEAISEILNGLRSNEHVPGASLYLSRQLLILLYVVKELSTAKLQSSRYKLQSVTPEIIGVLSPICVERVEAWLPFLKNRAGNIDDATESMNQSLLTLRILRRLVIAGYDFPNREKETRDLWSSLTIHFGQMLALVQSIGPTLQSQVHVLIERHLLQIVKFHLDMARSHPAGFALLPDAVSLAKAYWSLIRQCGETYGSQFSKTLAPKIGSHGDVDGGDTPILEKITLKGLLIFRACSKMAFNPVQTFRYQRDGDKDEKKLSKELMRQDLLTDGLAREVMETLVTRFFVFTSRDLKEWEEEPDEWEKSQEGGGEDWDFSIRTCSEKLFLDLMLNFRELLVQPLLSVFSTVASKRDALSAVRPSS